MKIRTPTARACSGSGINRGRAVEKEGTHGSIQASRGHAFSANKEENATAWRTKRCVGLQRARFHLSAA